MMARDREEMKGQGRQRKKYRQRNEMAKAKGPVVYLPARKETEFKKTYGEKTRFFSPLDGHKGHTQTRFPLGDG